MAAEIDVSRHRSKGDADSITRAEPEPERPHAEGWVRSVKEECLGKLILFGDSSLRRALTDFIDHFHCERNHQGKGDVLLFPDKSTAQRGAGHRVRCRQRLGGLLRFYAYAA